MVEQCSIYKLNSTNQSFDKILGDDNQNQQPLLISHNKSSFYKKLIDEKKTMIGNKREDVEAPLFGGVISINNKVCYVVIIEKIDFDYLNEQTVQFLDTLLSAISKKFEQDDEVVSVNNGSHYKEVISVKN